MQAAPISPATKLRIWDSATSQWVAEATPAAADISYADEGLANGTTYYYILRAMNDDGPGPMDYLHIGSHWECCSRRACVDGDAGQHYLNPTYVAGPERQRRGSHWLHAAEMGS